MSKRNEENFEYDFSGWGSKYGILCSDGRTIVDGAFQHQDGEVIPLIFQHDHKTPSNVLGKALIHEDSEGVYIYGQFNDSQSAEDCKQLLAHGDIDSLSIYANHLTETANGDVYHGDIKEVSLVLSGANVGAKIDNVLCHDSDEGDAAMIYSGEVGLEFLCHGDDDYVDDDDDYVDDDDYDDDDDDDYVDDDYDDDYVDDDDYDDDDDYVDDDDDDVSIEEVLDSLDADQMAAVVALTDAIQNDTGDDEMMHNDFSSECLTFDTVGYNSIGQSIMDDIKTFGSLKNSFAAHSDEFVEGGFLEHADDIDDVIEEFEEYKATYPRVENEVNGEDYGIVAIENLFPDAKFLNGEKPQIINRPQEWVTKVLSSCNKTPFSRIKSTYADLTEDTLRARGYVKGNYKKSGALNLLRRHTSPSTIYVKQTFDRDDLIDITWELLPYVKNIMEIKLAEEKARAILIGDGRQPTDPDKIKEDCIRPISSESDDLYVMNWVVDNESNGVDVVMEIIKACQKCRREYRGSGNPTLYTNNTILTKFKLYRDKLGRRMFKDEAAICRFLRVKEIVCVPYLTPVNAKTCDNAGVFGIIVNLNDYTIGTDVHSHRAFFNDFDIDYNKEKMLYEERFAGSMTTPFSAITLEFGGYTGEKKRNTSAVGGAAPYTIKEKLAKDHGTRGGKLPAPAPTESNGHDFV